MSDLKSKDGQDIEKGDNVSAPVSEPNPPTRPTTVDHGQVSRRGAQRRGEKAPEFGRSAQHLPTGTIPSCQVEQVVTDEDQVRNLDAKGAKTAPAVVFTDQNNENSGT